MKFMSDRCNEALFQGEEDANKLIEAKEGQPPSSPFPSPSFPTIRHPACPFQPAHSRSRLPPFLLTMPDRRRPPFSLAPRRPHVPRSHRRAGVFPSFFRWPPRAHARTYAHSPLVRDAPVEHARQVAELQDALRSLHEDINRKQTILGEALDKQRLAQRAMEEVTQQLAAKKAELASKETELARVPFLAAKRRNAEAWEGGGGEVRGGWQADCNGRARTC